MVVAEGMGDEHCQASGAEKSHRRTGTTARRDYASHVERWNRVPLDKGNGADNLSDERQTVGATIQRNDVPRGTMDETSSLWTLVSIALPRSVRESETLRQHFSPGLFADVVDHVRAAIVSVKVKTA